MRHDQGLKAGSVFLRGCSWSGPTSRPGMAGATGEVHVYGPRANQRARLRSCEGLDMRSCAHVLCAHDRSSSGHSSYEKQRHPSAVPAPPPLASFTATTISRPSPAMPQVTPPTYAAACNPSRRAKRTRVDAEEGTASSTGPVSRARPPILPKGPYNAPTQALDHDTTDEEEDEYDPVETVPAPKRRGRKPGPLSRSARESQRKLNHSRIEKARRTKINETLATLSALVSEAEKQTPGEAAPEPVVESKSKGEKEFKLDVLVKTVTYVQELLQKVKLLEEKACARCTGTSQSSPISPTMSPSTKRKRADDDDLVRVDVLEAAAESGDEGGRVFDRVHEPSKRRRPTQPSRSPSVYNDQSPCLPPISSWLPNPYVDPSCLPLSDPGSTLPTPPLSGSFRPPMAHPSQPLPALMLPGPAHPSLTKRTSPPQSPPSLSSMRLSMPPRRMSSTASPSVSPSWTPEDETAASLLLQMSTTAKSPQLRRGSLSGPESRSRRMQMQVETPSSMLGMARH